MSGRSRAKIFLSAALAFLVLSVVLGLISIYPTSNGEVQTKNIIYNDFHMAPNEVRRQGIGAFAGGENLTVKVLNKEDTFVKNFSIETYVGVPFNVSTSRNIIYNFTVVADYYEAIFQTNSSQSGEVIFQVDVTKPQTMHEFSWLGTPAKGMFIASITGVLLVLLNSGVFSRLSQAAGDAAKGLPSVGKVGRRRLLVLVVFSLAVWFVVLAFNQNPLGTFEGWYTDHARHPYTASLFLKDGFEVFSQPLDVLATRDSSTYMYVTWPEMPHLYPVGSIALFLPFGALLEAGFNALLVYKLEIGLFLLFAHACLYLFLKYFYKKDMHLFWKLVGFYILYVTLVVYAADGMFDSVSLFFGLLAVGLFMSEKYDGFVLLVVAAALFKYQAAIFMFPFIAVGVVKLFEQYRIAQLIRNKAAQISVVLVALIGVTAYMSLPYLLQTRKELVLNGVNAFSPHAQVVWGLQAAAVAATLTATLAYAVYMLKRNSFLSLSAVFLLLPSLTLPYFQNWYLPFYFIYMLVPQKRRDLEVTIVWLCFVTFMLSFGGAAFNPATLLGHAQSMVSK